MARLFDRIPGDLFSPLSRKYKAIYAFALVCLYRCLKLYKSDIKRSDYVGMLKSQGQEMLELFSVEMDQLDDKSEETKIALEKGEDDFSSKINYVVRKLSSCGWFIISRNPRTNVEYLYIPAYSIQLLRLIDELTSDIGSYLPLVHQTYAELKMEDEKEDDYMYRSLLNARHNADTIEMSVTLLKQQICVFGNRLTSVLDPNVALKQHFDEYRVSISDRYYHPMKTFDSLGLYAQPTIRILRRWLSSERLITLMVREAKGEPINRQRKEQEIASEIIKTINEVIDIFSRLSVAFNDIDAANARYTEAVQKKVNYLSSTDKTVKGKIDKIILSMASEIKSNPALHYEELPICLKARETLLLLRQGNLDSRSLTLPFKRGIVEDTELMPLEDDFMLTDEDRQGLLLIDEDVNRFSDFAIAAFLDRFMQGKDEITTYDIAITSMDDLVLMILAILKCKLRLLPYRAEKLQDKIDYAGYEMPLYQFRRTKRAR